MRLAKIYVCLKNNRVHEKDNKTAIIIFKDLYVCKVKQQSYQHDLFRSNFRVIFPAKCILNLMGNLNLNILIYLTDLRSQFLFFTYISRLV